MRNEKAQKKYSRRELAEEVENLTGQRYDPGYLADCLAGTRRNKTLEDRGVLQQAVSNLEANIHSSKAVVK